MLDPQHLLTLAAILRTGSFDGAAAQLGVTPPAVSQRIRALETQMGAPVLRRGPPVAATPLGARLARHAETVALLEAQVLAEVGQPAPPGQRVRIAVNADSLATWVVPALAQVPGLLFDVLVDDQDQTAARLRAGEVAAAITASDSQVTGCRAWPLGALSYAATASPAFVARHFADGVTAEAMAQAPALVFDRKDQLQHRFVRAAVGTLPRPMPHHVLPSTEGFVDAALVGLGWGLNPRPLVEGHLRSGALVELCPSAALATPLVWQVGLAVADALAPLTRAIRQAACQALIPVD